ncbi:MAG TPA: class I SAM-dependent methyltransferase [Gammaproteobacteria bacterium]|nr:class I SAM-dependent methyltransferase [Gammaproteobacteria bacterium]
MKPERGYQLNFSDSNPAMKDSESRIRKAKTMVAVLNDYFCDDIQTLRVLDVGASTGIIDHYLAQHFGSVTGIDIDKSAIQIASKEFILANLHFQIGDAMAIDAPHDSFDIVICSQVYEHVPNAKKMIEEIYRVLRPGGVCYFAASNRLMWNEPHYNLPLLSVLPRKIAHKYVRMAGRADFYHELHFSYWGLRKLVNRYQVIDYTSRIVEHPDRFGASYMMPTGIFKHRLARWMVRYVFWAIPGYIWLLKKP